MSFKKKVKEIVTEVKKPKKITDEEALAMAASPRKAIRDQAPEWAKRLTQRPKPKSQSVNDNTDLLRKKVKDLLEVAGGKHGQGGLKREKKQQFQSVPGEPLKKGPAPKRTGQPTRGRGEPREVSPARPVPPGQELSTIKDFFMGSDASQRAGSRKRPAPEPSEEESQKPRKIITPGYLRDDGTYVRAVYENTHPFYQKVKELARGNKKNKSLLERKSKSVKTFKILLGTVCKKSKDNKSNMDEAKKKKNNPNQGELDFDQGLTDKEQEDRKSGRKHAPSEKTNRRRRANDDKDDDDEPNYLGLGLGF